jgi:hypothetical protein
MGRTMRALAAAIGCQILHKPRALAFSRRFTLDPSPALPSPAGAGDAIPRLESSSGFGSDRSGEAPLGDFTPANIIAGMPFASSVSPPALSTELTPADYSPSFASGPGMAVLGPVPNVTGGTGAFH